MKRTAKLVGGILMLSLLALGWLYQRVFWVEVPEGQSAAPVHELWDTLVKQHVTPDGQVDYPGFAGDRERLEAYLDLLAIQPPNTTTWSDAEQMAYWINVYNAFTVQIVLDHYPVGSIREITPGIPFINSVWDEPLITLGGKSYTLNNIEHGILRTQFQDARIHAVLTCASISCPKLRTEAYIPGRLDEQLDVQMQEFLRNPNKNQPDPESPKLSAIFNWYGGDFEAEGGLIVFVNRFLDQQITAGAQVEFLEYDWGLNE
ncbi:MAG: DUF547 domain-containing protein [Bacteroidota bacterium]